MSWRRSTRASSSDSSSARARNRSLTSSAARSWPPPASTPVLSLQDVDQDAVAIVLGRGEVVRSSGLVISPRNASSRSTDC
jgi:hypothetical protein